MNDEMKSPATNSEKLLKSFHVDITEPKAN